MIKCVEAGNEIVALANLYPEGGVEELDSYMYQSVGHNVVAAYGECMDLPLYRRPIRGTPRNLEYDYEVTADDEVECLYELLREVKERHPQVRGVSSGAIMSTYQKNRVENVCGRLGLMSLAFLWEAPQAPLLQSMIDIGLEAILIKVAVYGLDVHDLGRTLQEMQPKLLQLAASHGINVCGEGGEFESLTLDCPLFRRRLVIDEMRTCIHRDVGTTQVSYLKLLKWHVEEKEEKEKEKGRN